MIKLNRNIGEKLQIFVVTFIEGMTGAIGSYFFPENFILIGFLIAVSGAITIIVIEYIENFKEAGVEIPWQRKEKLQNRVAAGIYALFVGASFLLAVMCWNYFGPEAKTAWILFLMCVFAALSGFLWGSYIYLIVNLNWSLIRSSYFDKNAEYRKLIRTLLILIPVLVFLAIVIHLNNHISYSSFVFWFYLLGAGIPTMFCEPF